MSEAFVIEVAGETAGAVFRERGGFRFVSLNPIYVPLDGKTFASVVEAESSAARLAPPRGRARNVDKLKPIVKETSALAVAIDATRPRDVVEAFQQVEAKLG